MKISHALIGATLLGIASSVLAAPPHSPLRVELKVKGADDSVTWNLTNRSNEDIYVLKRETPLIGQATGSAFEVKYGDKVVPYVGAIVHWGAPTADDFIKIEPHQTLTANVQLAESYKMLESGTYSVKFNGRFTTLLSAADIAVSDRGSLQVSSAQVEVHSKGHSLSHYQRDLAALLGTRQIASGAPPSGSSSLVYTQSCSVQQQNWAVAGHNQAKTYAGNAFSSLAHIGARYTTWFGAYDYGRYAKVYNTFSNTRWALNNANITYSCYCEPAYQSSYAYVWPNQPYVIHLCSKYWSAPTSGRDSKGGTIVHEMTHFNAIGSTGDSFYGEYQAKWAAKYDPWNAVWNADNYEFFAENTPYLY